MLRLQSSAKSILFTINMRKIILASKSPRRKELLSRIKPEFECVEPNIKENNALDCDNPWLVAMENARLKAENVFASHSDSIVIGADTIVVLDGKVLGKPGDREDAKRMLKSLSGVSHEVYTGIYIKSGDKDFQTYEVTTVFFSQMSDSEIESYVATGEPMDKAGAYGIQGLGSVYVKGIKGDFYNVVGLPLCCLANALKYF